MDGNAQTDLPSQQEFLDAVAEEFAKRPPTIGVIGLSGVGKSSTINAMFGTSLPVSATIRGTTKFISSDISVDTQELFGGAAPAVLRVLDAPGLGEDIELDKKYLDYYRHHLKKCDAVIWVLAARNRALALDQRYLKTLKDRIPNLAVGINQADVISPMNWNDRINMPSPEQRQHLDAIRIDRQGRLSKVLGRRLNVVIYSASRYYGLFDLFNACVDQAAPDRRWMFEIIRKFSPDDWLERASALSDEEREKIKQTLGVQEKSNMEDSIMKAIEIKRKSATKKR